MPTRHNCITAALFTGVLLSTVTNAQWSDDATVNTLVSGALTNCVITHTAAAPDGGVWIAWYDASAGYDVIVQRLDSAGVPVFAQPIIVQDQSLSWVQDFDLATVGNDCALAWADGTVIGAALVSANGSIAWQHNLQDGNGYQANAQVCGANDDFTVVAWADEDVTKVQRIGTDGTLVWDTPVSIGGNGFFLASDIKPASDHDVVVSMVQYLSFNGAKVLKAQRIRADGSLAWGTQPVDVFTQGSLQYGNYPECIADDSGGAVFTWYSSSNLQSYVQWIDGDGVKLFGVQGVSVATSGNLLHTGPSACYDQGADEVTVFCTRQSANQAEDGVQVNRFGRNGLAIWGAAGIELDALTGAAAVLDLQAIQLGPLATVSWLKLAVTGQGTVRGQAINAPGAIQWGAAPIGLGEPNLGRNDLTGAVAGDLLVAVWSDARDGFNRVYAQSLDAEGVLGPAGCIADITGDEMVGVDDLLDLIAAWGLSGSPADVNGDGVVDTLDLLLILAGWGACP